MAIHKVRKIDDIQHDNKGIDHGQDKEPLRKEPLFRTIQSAVDYANPNDIIEIGNGIYYEKVHIKKSHLTLVGESAEGCVITYDDYALKAHEDRELYGTFRTYTCLVLGDHITIKNLTIENAAGDGRTYGQAIALYAQGNRLSFIGCNFIGHQDTLFLGPLPEKAKIPGSFGGPTEHIPYKKCKQYFDQCRIIGDVDYIFGSALGVFHRCSLITRNRNSKVNGYVTAPSTWQHEPYGFVFIESIFLGEKGMGPETVFFGRPWRPFGQVKLIQCSYDQTIHQNHWDPWGDESNKKTARFSEHGCKELESKALESRMSEGLQVDESYDDSPFIIRTREIPDLSFLEPWHQKMIQESMNERLER